MTCNCSGCQTLYAEVVAGTKPELMDRAEATYEHYRKQLLKKGWAGLYSPAEKAYGRAHRLLSEAQQAGLARARQAATAAGFSVYGHGRKPRRATGTREG